MAVVEDRVVLAISLLDLVQALCDQEGTHAIAGEKGEDGLEEIQAAERGELVEHHEKLVLGGCIGAVLGIDRKGVVEGKRVSVRVDLGGGRKLKNKKKKK